MAAFNPAKPPRAKKAKTRCPNCGKPLAYCDSLGRLYEIDVDPVAVDVRMPSLGLFFSAGGQRFRGSAVDPADPLAKRWGFACHRFSCPRLRGKDEPL